MTREGSFGVVLAAGGAGLRFGKKKQFLEILGRPVLFYSLDAFASLEDVVELALVVPREDVGQAARIVGEWSGRDDWQVRIVCGGDRRQDSVRSGLECFWDSVDCALVHDAARPLVRVGDVARLMEAIRLHGAGALGHPASDSIKKERDGRVVGSLNRKDIWQVQTPQGAACDLFKRAYAAVDAATEMTDEAALLAAIDAEVRLVEGSEENVKLTRPGDEELAEFLLGRRAKVKE